MREDLSLPLFAAHLWLLARAARVRTPAAIALSALALLGALATWHAMGFVASLEAACLFAWFLRTGQNPLAARGAWIFPTLVALGSLAVPVLRAKLFLLSPPMQVAAALGVAAASRHRSGVGPRSGALVGVGALVACAALAFGLTRVLSGALGDYGHVLELMWSKLRFGGVLPDDPEAISFGARLLWQGPFETGSLASLVTRVGAPAVLLPVAVLSALPVWWRGRGDSRMALLAGLLVAAVAASLLVRRLEVLVGLLAPVAAAALLRDLRPEKATAWIAGLLLVQAATFAPRIAAYTTDSWYPPRYQAELRQIVDWIARELPPDGAIAADFVTSTSVLAYTGHPVVLQPKYETRRSRDRIEAFCRQLYRGSPAEFARWLREEVDARYLLVDVQILWPWRYQCGLPRSSEAPPAGSAAAALMDPDLSKVEALRDFRLRYRNAEPPHAWRLFEIEGHAPGSGAP